MLRLIFALALSLPVLGSTAVADLRVASLYMPDAQLAGKARLKYLAWNVYDAELYAPSGRWNPDAPYALSLYYLRAFSGKSIATRSVEEIRKQGFKNEAVLSDWQRKMEKIFPDVTNKTNITGVRDKNGHAIFFRNGKKIGTIRDREFSDRFFSIWLGNEASDPEFRRKLTGAS